MSDRHVTRVTAVLTHPVQYYAPVFARVTQAHPEIALTVVYAIEPTPEQQGTGFDRRFSWDTPLREGYSSIVARPARPGDSVDAASFFGVDAPQIASTVASTRPDIVVLFGWYSVALLRALRWARRAGIPIVYHGDTNLQSAPTGWRRPLWCAKTRFLLKRFARCLSVGVRSTGFLRYFGVDPARVFDMPHAVDTDRFGRAVEIRRSPARRAEARSSFGLDRDAFVVAFAGKLEEKKRPLDVIRAVARMRPADRALQLLVAGAGRLENVCRAEAETLGVAVRWSGFVNQTRMIDVYAAADCVVLPSDGRETWGLVANEALAAGVPVVVSQMCGCAPDLVDAATGGVAPVGDVAELATEIDGVRDRIESGRDYTHACVARAATHSVNRAADAFASAVTHTIPRRPHTSSIRTVVCCGGMVVTGGLERMTFEVLRALGHRGGAVHCLLNDWEYHRIATLADGIGASWVPHRYEAHFHRTRNPLVLARLAWESLRSSAGLLAECYRFRATHILLPDFVGALRYYPALVVAKLVGLQTILRLGYPPGADAFYARLWRWVVQPVVDRFVCNSAYTERELLKLNVARAKVSTVPNTAPLRSDDVPRRTARADGRIIYVGQVIAAKGVDLLLDAFAQLRARGHDVSLDIVGRVDGWTWPGTESYLADVRARASDPALRDHVRLLGWREDVPALMAAASVHCCPSRAEQREGFGVVVLEAKRAGIPSVVTPSGALPSLIRHGVDGWVCRRFSAADIADGLEYFLSDPDRLRAAGAAAHASADQFSRERFVDGWSAVFAGTHA